MPRLTEWETKRRRQVQETRIALEAQRRDLLVEYTRYAEKYGVMGAFQSKLGEGLNPRRAWREALDVLDAK